MGMNFFETMDSGMDNSASTQHTVYYIPVSLVTPSTAVPKLV